MTLIKQKKETPCTGYKGRLYAVEKSVRFKFQKTGVCFKRTVCFLGKHFLCKCLSKLAPSWSKLFTFHMNPWNMTLFS